MNQDAGRRERRRVATGDPAIGYLDAGPRTGEALVLLHSLGTDHRLWLHQIDGLAAEYRLIAPDSRGHGGSGWAGPPTLRDWVADLDRVLDHARVDRAVVAGLSMGGVQALAFAARHPERVRALVVADSFAELEPEVARAKTDGFVRRVSTDGTSAFAAWYVAETFTTTPLPVGAEWVRAAIAGITPEAFTASARTCFAARLGDEIGAIQVPTLVLWGERDAKTPREASDFIVSRVKGARFGVVREAGHLSAVENPEEFTRLVADFVAGLGTEERREVNKGDGKQP
jgi:3-oxoadipate enol-lactonase